MFKHIYLKEVIRRIMSAMTDRVTNQDLIQLAKKQYEDSKRSSIPSELIRLVSNGMVYPKDHPLRDGTIEMRYMTAYDEDILTNPSYIREGVVLDKLLESLIVTPVDYSTISRVDKNGLIISARILSYGKDYPVQVTNPKTSNTLQRIVDLNKLKHSEFNLVSDENGEFDYELTNGTKLKFKFLLNNDNVDLSISKFLEHTICQVNDSRSKTDIDDFIRYKFLASESKKFRNYMSDNTPSVVLEYEFEGEDGDTFTAMFQIGADLFWF
jgi:hypothetical protein